MELERLPIADAFAFSPRVLPDRRGAFFEILRQEWWQEALGRTLPVAQVNATVNHRGTVRGIHFTRLPGQAKYVCCLAGAMVDVIVDTRLGSPTYGQHATVRLDAEHYRIVYLPEGVGHGIASLEDNTTAFYLCSAPYDAANEYGVDPFDAELGIDWVGMLDGVDPILSDRDQSAVSLAAVRAAGLLPDYAECRSWYDVVGRGASQPLTAGVGG